MPLNNFQFLIFNFFLTKNMKLSIFKTEIHVKINLYFLLNSGYLLNIMKLWLLKKHSSYFCIIPTLPVLTDYSVKGLWLFFRIILLKVNIEFVCILLETII